MADKKIEVGYNTGPLLTFQLTDFRNENNSSGIVDITGYSFKLRVKKNLTDPDSAILVSLNGSILVAASGTFTFQLTTAHTCLPPGKYVGQILWWSGAVGTTPTDSWTVEYNVADPVDNVFP